MSTASDEEHIPEISFQISSKGLFVACAYKVDDSEARVVAWQINQALGLEMMLKTVQLEGKISKMAQHENFENKVVVFEIHTKVDKETKQLIISEMEDYLAPPPVVQERDDAEIAKALTDKMPKNEMTEAYYQSIMEGYFPLLDKSNSEQ